MTTAPPSPPAGTDPPGTDPAGTHWPVLERGGLRAAPLLLGATLTVARGGQMVSVRLTEVEAYEGGRDPGSHAYRGRTARTETMFGPAGHLYVYFTYGMHWCANIVCGTDGTSSAVLLRAGEVTEGVAAAAARRGPRAPGGHRLASGPARLAQCLGLGDGDDGTPLLHGPVPSAVPGEPGRSGEPDPSGDAPLQDGAWLSGIRSRRRPGTRSGPRTGVSGPGGQDDYPWRFWLPGEPSVSPYRAAKPRSRG